MVREISCQELNERCGGNNEFILGGIVDVCQAAVNEGYKPRSGNSTDNGRALIVCFG